MEALAYKGGTQLAPNEAKIKPIQYSLKIINQSSFVSKF
jgi:hypothetical protein